MNNPNPDQSDCDHDFDGITCIECGYDRSEDLMAEAEHLSDIAENR